MTDKHKIIERIKKMLSEGYTVISLRRKYGQIGPYMFTSVDDIPELTIDYPVSEKYPLTKLAVAYARKFPEKKIALVSRGCDIRALRRLEKLGITKSKIETVVIPCSYEDAKFCNCEKPEYRTELCTGCWVCFRNCKEKAIEIINPCPVLVSNEFDRYFSFRKAIYVPFPQSVPLKYTRDREHCLKLRNIMECKGCNRICEPKAIHDDDTELVEELNVGAIIVATGFDLMPKEKLGEYGYGKYKDVVDALAFERLLAPAGPTAGIPRRVSDGKIPKEVVFVQCVGSRDLNNYPYCSRICCMYVAKQAMLYKHAVPDGQAYVFYIDIRSAGKGYEEFIQRAMEEYGVVYLRGKVAKIFEQNGKVTVWGVDTLTGKGIEIEADMVVLATAAVASQGIEELAKKLRVPTKYGWLTEAHLKLRPFETLTAGIFIAGCSQYPKDITDSVAQGSGAAAKVLDIFSKDYLVREPTIATVDTEICTGCGYCEQICPYKGIEVDKSRKVAVVNEKLCEGCGGCSAVCSSGAVQLRNMTRNQILDMIDSVILEKGET